MNEIIQKLAQRHLQGYIVMLPL